jgi:signal peptidase I
MSQPVGDGPLAALRRLRRHPGQTQPRHESSARTTRGSWSLAREGAGILVAATVLSLVVKMFLVQPFFIPSGSMEPTLHGCKGCGGDRVLVNKLTDQMGGVDRGDVIVFHDSYGWLPPETGETDLIKRVIGVGGDTVEARRGKVYVNGTQLDEPYVWPGDRPSDVDFRVTVPIGKLWVMGDHRSESGDSRFHQQGPGEGFVPEKDVLGRAFVIIWPPNRAGSLDRPTTFDRAVINAKH